MSEDNAGGGGGDWCTIESDPGVFTELLEHLGVKGVELQELWSLDDDCLQNELLAHQGHVYGLIFLFQWIGPNSSQPKPQRQPLPESEIPPDLFFAHQVTTNACATQAILSVLFNSNSNNLANDTLELGNVLSEFQSFTKDFPPSLKGVAISSSEEIKKCHNSFSRQDAFLEEGKFHVPTGKEEAFHFVAYVPFNEVVYELDGLQKGPIVIGDVAEASTSGEGSSASGATIPAWLKVAREAIQERMALYQNQESSSEGSGGIKFNLMAVVQDKRLTATEQTIPVDTERELFLQQEQAKREQWKLENERRRHNYVPLCIQILKELAQLGTLPELAQQASERIAAKRAAGNKS